MGEDMATFKSVLFYTNELEYWFENGWDFAGVWYVFENESLPFLQWQYVAVTDITGVPETATVNVSLTLEGTVSPNNATVTTIVWSISPLDDGSTNAEIVDGVFTATAAGTAIVTATIANGFMVGASYTQDFGIEVKNNVGINDILSNKISVYPNPVSNILYFSLETAYELTDLQGRTLLKSNKAVKSVNINSLPAGIYFVTLTTESGKTVKRIIKE